MPSSDKMLDRLPVMLDDFSNHSTQHRAGQLSGSLELVEEFIKVGLALVFRHAGQVNQEPRPKAPNLPKFGQE
jgi:hypothetical protein